MKLSRFIPKWLSPLAILLLIAGCTTEASDDSDVDPDLKTPNATLQTVAKAYEKKDWLILKKTLVDSVIRFYLRTGDRWDYNDDGVEDGYYDYYALESIHRALFKCDSISWRTDGDYENEDSFDPSLMDLYRTLFASIYKDGEKKKTEGQLIFKMKKQNDKAWRITEIIDKTGAREDSSLGLLYKYYWKGSF